MTRAELTRREVVRDAVAGGVLLGTFGWVAACGGGDDGGAATGGSLRAVRFAG